MKVVDKILMFLILVGVSLAVYDTVDSFYNRDSSSFQMSFESNMNNSWELNIPSYGKVINFTFNVSPIFTNYVTIYQEFADTNYSGSNWVNISRVFDGDFDTGSNYTGGKAVVSINYTLPVTTQNAKWRVKDGCSEVNLTVPFSELNRSNPNFRGALRLEINHDNSNTEWFMYYNNGTNAVVKDCTVPTLVYEEAMYWNLSPYINNATVNLGEVDNNPEEQITLIDQSSQISINNSVMENLMNNGCQGGEIIGSDCIVPINVSGVVTGASSTIISVELINLSYEFGIERCQATEWNYTVLTLNYTDEVLGTYMSADNNYDINAISNFTVGINGSEINKLGVDFCSNLDPTERSVSGVMQGSVLLEKDEYASRNYVFPLGSGLEWSNNDPQIYNLSLIRINESSTVVFTWLSTTFEAISGVQNIYRCDGGGNRVLVDAVPIIDGSSTANIELLNIPYSYEVVIDGVIYTDETTYTQCHIETESTRQYFVELDEVDLTQPIGMLSIDCNVTETGTNQVKMSWSTNPESSLPITGCIYADRLSSVGTQNVYTNCTSTEFEIERTIPASGFVYHVYGRLFQGGYSVECGDVVEFGADTSTSAAFGLSGVFSIFILIAAMILFFSNSGSAQVFGAGAGLIVGYILGVIAFGWIPMSSLLAFLIIILLIGRRSRT